MGTLVVGLVVLAIVVAAARSIWKDRKMERAVEAAEEDAEDAPSARRKTDSDYT